MTDNNVARCKKCYGVALEPDGYEHILWHQSEDKKERAFRRRLLDLETTIAQFEERIKATERTVAVVEADNTQMRAELDQAEAADMAAPLVVSDLEMPTDPDIDEDDPFAGEPDEDPTPSSPPVADTFPHAIDRPDEPVPDALTNLYTPRTGIYG